MLHSGIFGTGFLSGRKACASNEVADINLHRMVLGQRLVASNTSAGQGNPQVLHLNTLQSSSTEKQSSFSVNTLATQPSRYLIPTWQSPQNHTELDSSVEVSLKWMGTKQKCYFKHIFPGFLFNWALGKPSAVSPDLQQPSQLQMADQLPKTCSLHIQHEGPGLPMDRLLSPPAPQSPGCQLHTGIFRRHVGETTSSTMVIQHEHGLMSPPSTWLASQISPSIPALMALGCYQYTLLAFPLFILLQILPPAAIPGILLNFTPQTWLLTPNTATDSTGVQHIPASGAGVPMAHAGFSLLRYKQPISRAVFASGKLAYEFHSRSL